MRFNTASGKHCCNDILLSNITDDFEVSIPQAVSTVATGGKEFIMRKVLALVFQYRKR